MAQQNQQNQQTNPSHQMNPNQQMQQGQQMQMGQSTQTGQGMQFADKDILQLALNESKHAAETLNASILESSNEQLRRDYMTILGDIYNQQKQIFDMMQQKGYYKMQNASEQEISQAQSKFNQM